MFKDFPASALAVLKNAADFTVKEVIAAAHAITMYAAELEAEVISGELTIPADYIAQLDKFIADGLDKYLPAWVVQLAIDKLNSYLLPKK